MSLKVAARQSDLARIQALAFGQAFRKSHSDVEIDFFFKESLGDKNLDDPLWKMPEQGVFTKDFYEELVSKKRDCIVHSWKDLPTEKREHTEIYASLPREDMRDLLLFKKSSLPRVLEIRSITVFSSSPRREYNLRPFLKWALPKNMEDIKFTSVRGNVPTRIRKLLADDSVDAMVVAKAAIDRLLGTEGDEFTEEFKQMRSELRSALAELNWMVLPLMENPAAAAQGALAVEIREDNEQLKTQLDAFSCQATMLCVQAERETLSNYGGGCHQKIGVSILQREYGRIRILRGLTEAGETLNQTELVREQDLAWPRVDKDSIFPFELGQAKFFDRETIEVPAKELSAKPLWIARANALPDSYQPEEGQTIWCSGLKSWRRLAERGVWVNGCAEGLGENEDAQLEHLAGHLNWVKLTHEDGMGENKLATYRLVAKQSLPDLAGKTHFFWSSFSQFQLALKNHPRIAGGYHACGPGHTYQAICSRLGGEARIGIFLSHDDWLKEVLKWIINQPNFLNVQKK